MGNAKLFVSNLDFELNADSIKEIFAEYGTVVNLTLVTDRESGKSRGYCFIEMSTGEEAQKAVEGCNGKLFNGRPISVAEDRGKKPAGPREKGEGREGGGAAYLQPMQRVLFFRRKKKLDPFLESPTLKIDYRDARLLSKFLSERGRVLPRRLTGLSAYHQRRISKAIKRAQHLAILPYSGSY